jgi:mono/diheme cytochrome c family protein
MTRLTTATLSIALLLSSAVAQNLTYHQDPKWHPPSQTMARPNPLPQTSEFVGGGRKLFLRHCAECHGENGRGLKRAADLQLPLVQNQSDGALFWKITNGNLKRGMPSWGRLPELQRWQLVLFLRTLPSVQSRAQAP